MKIMIWNVNGLRSVARKGFDEWLARARPDILGIQEARAFPEQVTDITAGITEHRLHWNPAVRPGYSGTLLFTKTMPVSIETRLGEERFDCEGRTQIAEFETFWFFNVYFPKGSGKERDNSRVPFKLEFYEKLLARALACRRSKPVIIGGDFNTAHTPLDLANWKSNDKTSGFLAEERAMIDRYLEAGFTDIFRDLHESETGHYTWWSQRQGARGRNVGWRIDYFLISTDLASRVRRAWIEPDVLGSDHCPVGLELL